MRTFVLISVGAVIALLLLFGCPKSQESPQQQRAIESPIFAKLPIEITVKQRTTTEAPDSNGEVSVTVDDITRGQVMISIAGKDGAPLLAPTSLSVGKFASFKLGGDAYFVVLKALDNELIGDDGATLEITSANPEIDPSQVNSSSSLPNAVSTEVEQQRIMDLIERVRKLREGAVFIRNGQEHTPEEAAEHLQRKWEAAGDEISTSEEFIEKIASKSYTSGEPYRIRFDRGERDAGDWLRLQLSQIKKDEVSQSPIE